MKTVVTPRRPGLSPHVSGGIHISGESQKQSALKKRAEVIDIRPVRVALVGKEDATYFIPVDKIRADSDTDAPSVMSRDTQFGV